MSRGEGEGGGGGGDNLVDAINPWGWAASVQDQVDINLEHVLRSYRILAYNCCDDSRKICPDNPFCYWGLGESRWVEYDAEQECDNHWKEQRRHEIKILYPSLPLPTSNCSPNYYDLKAFDDNDWASKIHFVPSAWMVKWLDEDNTLPEPLNNVVISCEHGRLAPPQPNSTVCLYKAIPRNLAFKLFDHYHVNGPKLDGTNAFCVMCIRKRFQELKQQWQDLGKADVDDEDNDDVSGCGDAKVQYDFITHDDLEREELEDAPLPDFESSSTRKRTAWPKRAKRPKGIPRKKFVDEDRKVGQRTVRTKEEVQKYNQEVKARYDEGLVHIYRKHGERFQAMNVGVRERLPRSSKSKT